MRLQEYVPVAITHYVVEHRPCPNGDNWYLVKVIRKLTMSGDVRSIDRYPITRHKTYALAAAHAKRLNVK